MLKWWFKKSKSDVSEEPAKKDEENEPDDATTKSDKDESVKDDSVKDDSVKDESVKDESVKDESVKDESVKDESVKDESDKDESVKDESDKDESDKAESASGAEKSSENKSDTDKDSEKEVTFADDEKEESDESKSSPDKDEDPEKVSSEEPHSESIAGEKSETDSENSDIILLDGDGPEYAFDEVVDIAGYGMFQKQLTLLAGMGWFADAFEIIILSLLGEYLACSWEFYRWENSLLTSTVFVGMMFGAPFFGVIADNYGRRKALAISLLFLFLFGACSALSRNFVTLVVLRSMMGFSLGGIAQGITLCSEYYPAKNRGIAGFYLSYYWAIGTILLILVAWLIMETTSTSHGWQWLLFAASIPALLVFISIKWYPESVRFYLVNNQHEKAVEQLNVLLKKNKADLARGTLKRSQGLGADEKKGNILDLLRPPHTLTTLLFWYIWFAAAFHYYGLVLISPVIIKQGKLILTPEEKTKVFNSTTSSEFFMSIMPCAKFSNQFYLDMLWTSAAEFPGLLVFTLLVQYVQRKVLLGASSFINTVVVLLLLVDFNSPIPTKILLFFGRANICGIFQLVFIMTSETFPTTLRAVSMGSGSAYARLGGAVVPFATQGLIIQDPIATICIISAVILLCGLAAALLPHEMKDVHMKDFSGQYKKRGEKKESA